MRFLVHALFLLMIAAPALAQQGAGGHARPVADSEGARVQVLTATDQGVTISVVGLRAVVDQRNGRAAISTNVTSVAQRGVDPSELTLTIGVPADAHGFTAKVIPAATERVALSAPPDSAFDREATSPITVTATAGMRGIRTVQVRYRPIALDGGGLRVDKGATITVSWKRSGKGGKEGEAAAYREIVAIEQMLASQIVNYRQARSWRAVYRPSASSLAAVNAGGWGLGRAMILHTPNDGIYRVGLAEMREAGAGGASGLDGTPIDRLALRNRRQPVPLHVDDRNGNTIFDGDDAIEFYGTRNRSTEGLYYDDFTDTNAYVLTWEGAGGPQLGAGSGAAQPLVAYDSTLHFEQDILYILGVSLNPFADGGDIRTIHVSERVPHERYYWQRMINTDQKFIPFNCAPAYGSGKTFRLKLRVSNSTYSEIPLNVALNTYGDLGTVMVADTSDTLFTFDVPAGFLINGENVLKLLTTRDDNDPRDLYIDYFEIEGSWLPSTFGDVAKAIVPKSGPSRRTIAVTGLKNGSLTAVSDSNRVAIAAEQGHLFRLTSRQFERAELRVMSGFVVSAEGDRQAGSDNAGLFLAVADGTTGKLLRSATFNTYGNPLSFDSASAFLDGVGQNDYLIGGFAVGFWDPFQQSGRRAAAEALRSKLVAMGARSLQGVNLDGLFVSSWAFAARRNNPTGARDSLRPGLTGISIDAFFPNAGGSSWRASFTASGSPGSEVVIAPTAASRLRYHAADSLVAPGNSAAMIIVTHPAFMAQSNRLAGHRRQQPPADDRDFTVRVVDVNTIYDEFNDGIKSPLAIRRFLQYADSNWSDPKPGYVLLFGDASWDPQRRRFESKMIDYVPTMGNPASDYIYTVPFSSVNQDSIRWFAYDTAMSWRQIIGRLPASTVAEAGTIVDKIVEYDNLAPAAWNKRFVFIAGGGDAGQVFDNRSVYENILNTYVLRPDFQGDTALIYRTTDPDRLRQPDTKDAPWARSEINKGALAVSFTGHGSTDVFDLDFGYPQDLNNEHRYFLLGTYSCQTGAFAEPGGPLRNELFLNYPGKGAIAAIGATGYSWTHLNEATQQYLFAGLTGQPTMNNLGALFTMAKHQVFLNESAGGSWIDNGFRSFRARNHLMMYSLLGDPSMDLALSRLPELALPGDVARVETNDGKEPNVGDKEAVIRLQLWNYGTMLASEEDVVVVATITDLSGTSHTVTETVTGLERSRQLELRFPLSGEPGEYTIRVEADPAQRITESYRADNILVLLPLRIQGNQPLVLEPIPYGSVQNEDDVVIRLLNPPSGPDATFDLDTTERFDSPARFTSENVGDVTFDELTTTWRFSMPENLRGARRYWWRAVAKSGDPRIAELFPLVNTFTIDADSNKQFVIGGVGQMARAQRTSLANETSGVGPGFRPVEVEMRAIGQSRYTNDQEIFGPRMWVTIDGRDINLESGAVGITAIRLDPVELNVLGMSIFYFWDGPSADPQIVDKFIDYVRDSVQSGEIVLLGTRGASLKLLRETPRRSELLQAFETLGGTRRILDSLDLQDSYALIGGKGIDPAMIREAWVGGDSLVRARATPPNFYAEVTVRNTFTAVPKAGRLRLPTIGPATAWRSAKLDLATGSPVGVTVYGVRRDGVSDSLRRVQADNGTVDLGWVDVKTYPKLTLQADFVADGEQRLRELAVDFDPSPELALVPSTFGFERDSVLQGDPGIFRGTVVNLSRRRPAEGFLVHLFDEEKRPQPVDSLTVETLGPLDSLRATFSIPTELLVGISSPKGGERTFSMALNMADLPAEPYRTNNQLTKKLRIGHDSLSPNVIVFADNSRLLDGDYVRPVPQFEIRIMDNSAMEIDSAKIRLTLDDNLISIESENASFRTINSDDHRASFFYTPPEALPDGEHALRLTLSDATGNQTITEFLIFYVERDLRLLKVVNFPNPMVDRTAFTFVASGGNPPTSGEVAIFTVAGRKIKTIPLTAADLRIGFNRVEWDGRDEDGDQMANGVYLYRLTIDDGEAKQEALEKLVIMR